jgi:hypothetical protein
MTGCGAFGEGGGAQTSKYRAGFAGSRPFERKKTRLYTGEELNSYHQG